MSIKSTQRVTRAQALELLLSEIMSASNDTLGNMLDTIADSKQSTRISYFDNFIVSEFV